MSSSSAAEQPYPNQGYAWYVVFVLVVAYTFSFIDRQILALLVGPIKQDLGLSDTLFSLLGGIAFASFYTLLGLPIGRMADRRSRRGIIIVGITVWSLMTALCGLTKNFWQLFLARMGVGVGEAALSPAAYSMIADYFRPRYLGTAISVYGMGIYIGSGLAFIVGGTVVSWASNAPDFVLPVLGTIRPWQLTFLAVGLPGLLVVLLMMTVKEPKRRGLVKKAEEDAVAEAAPIRDVVAFVRERWRTFLAHFMGFAPLSLIGYGTSQWMPAFFERTFDGFQVALWFGTIILIFGPLGIVAGGALADRWRQKGHKDSYLRVGMLAALVLIPINIFQPLMPDVWLAIALIVPSAFFGAMPFGVAPAAVQAITPNHMRGQISALYLFTVNMIGLGLGPTIIALCTDFVFRDEMLLKYSLSLVGGITGIWAVLLLFSGLKPYRKCVDDAQAWAH